jgi:predicted NUDIX family NTP pyrophosphohydrolase
MFKNMILISAAIVGEIEKGKLKFFLVRNNEDSEWEIPKLTVRKTESSVRAVLRMIGEQAGMRARILDEAARFSSNQQVNGKSVTQKMFYYALLHKVDSGESVGFHESVWLEYPKAYKKLSLKREKESLSSANRILKEWWKRRKGRMKRATAEE